MINELSPRIERTVKPFGAGSGHIIIPGTFAKPGDKILIVRLDEGD